MEAFNPKPLPTKLGGAMGTMEAPELGDYEKIGVTERYYASMVTTGMGYGSAGPIRKPVSTRASFPGYGLPGTKTLQAGGAAARGWDFGGRASIKYGSVDVSGLAGFGFARILNTGMAKWRIK